MSLQETTAPAFQSGYLAYPPDGLHHQSVAVAFREKVEGEQEQHRDHRQKGAGGGVEGQVAHECQYEIDEYSIMEDFIWSLPEGEMQNKLVGKIRGRGAFSRFRDGIYRFGIEKDWYEYLEKAHREIAVEWCEKNGFEIA